MPGSVAVLGPESWAEGVLQRIVGGGGGEVGGRKGREGEGGKRDGAGEEEAREESEDGKKEVVGISKWRESSRKSYCCLSGYQYHHVPWCAGQPSAILLLKIYCHCFAMLRYASLCSPHQRERMRVFLR